MQSISLSVCTRPDRPEIKSLHGMPFNKALSFSLLQLTQLQMSTNQTGAQLGREGACWEGAQRQTDVLARGSDNS